MDSATNRVVSEILHLHRFVDDTLASECRITMDQERNNFVSSMLHSVNLVDDVVLSSDSAHNYRVDTLKMGWIWQNFNSHFLSVFEVLGVHSSKVILDIT